MRIPRPKLSALFTRSPLIESTEDDDIDEGLASHRALFTEMAYETDLKDDSASETIDPWGRDVTSFLSGTYPDQGVDYILLADADIRVPPSGHSTYTSLTDAIDTWTRYPGDVAHAYIYLNHIVAAVHSNIASSTAAPRTAHTVNNLTRSAIQTILYQLDGSTLDAAQLKRENAVLRATVSRYEQENEDLEDTICLLTKVHNAERRLCMCVHDLDQPRPQEDTSSYGRCRFVEGRIPSWERDIWDLDWLGEQVELGT